MEGEVDKRTRIHMKRSKKLLWKAHDDLTQEQYEKVSQILAIDSPLREQKCVISCPHRGSVSLYDNFPTAKYFDNSATQLIYTHQSC
ncbi:hypothetical protein JOE23_002554 [Amphibacillus cookii]|nr:hypothetical protein [Amphibacillus cookii]